MHMHVDMHHDAWHRVKLRCQQFPEIAVRCTGCKQICVRNVNEIQFRKRDLEQSTRVSERELRLDILSHCYVRVINMYKYEVEDEPKKQDDGKKIDVVVVAVLLVS